MYSRRGDGRIAELCNCSCNAEDGLKDKQDGIFLSRDALISPYFFARQRSADVDT